MKSFWLLGCCGALLVISAGLGHRYVSVAGSEDVADAIAKPQTIAVATNKAASHANILDELIKADVIYLGETHNDPEDHAAQLEIITAMHESRGDIAIGLEMFQRPFQAVLDQYIAGDLTEAELIEQSEYETRWGFDWELYAPIIRYAQSNQIPLLALNTPREITKKV
ncbi:MAG: ChaN family lipoprotein, partial [Cyanobacteria bacterium J06642_11]